MTIKQLLTDYKTVENLLDFIESEIKPVSLDFLIDLGMQHLQSNPDLWRAFKASPKLKQEKALLAAGIVAYEIEMKNFLD
jgi:hypothetical protein